MKLYSSPFSSNARKVRLAAALLGISLELMDVNLGQGAQRKPEFLALNPMGRVPVLEDGAFVLAESATRARRSITAPARSTTARPSRVST
jgi:glutathione S-transferase